MEPLGSLEELTQALRCLPGVGPKAAQRMALHLLQHDRDGAQRLSRALEAATQTIRHCERCNTFTEGELCALCRSTKRDPALLCVVETPADLFMIEHTQAYSGLYFVLMGRLSPLDGIGPKEIRLDRLLKRALDGVVREVVLAVPEASRHLTDRPYADKLKAAIEQVLGRRVRLRFEIGGAAATTLAAQEKRERDAAQAQTEAAFREDPFVQDVLSRFDARIKPNSIKRV